MKYPYSIKIDSEEGTKKIAGEFSGNISCGDVIVLNGNLGSGKTFFVREVVKNFGINKISSPTFAIVNEYSGDQKIYHFDFYRINDPVELFDIGFNDYLNDSDSIIFIEWGNMFSDILPEKFIEIEIKMGKDLNREFSFKKYE